MAASWDSGRQYQANNDVSSPPPHCAPHAPRLSRRAWHREVFLRVASLGRGCRLGQAMPRSQRLARTLFNLRSKSSANFWSGMVPSNLISRAVHGLRRRLAGMPSVRRCNNTKVELRCRRRPISRSGIVPSNLFSADVHRRARENGAMPRALRRPNTTYSGQPSRRAMFGSEAVPNRRISARVRERRQGVRFENGNLQADALVPHVGKRPAQAAGPFPCPASSPIAGFPALSTVAHRSPGRCDGIYAWRLLL